MSDSKQSRKINRFFAEFIAKLRKWLNKIGSPIRISRRLVRQLLGASRGKGAGKAAGFVLPTVTLVTLIVTLLVVTTVARSSQRAQSAANARTEQVFKSAATPIVDRARAKIDALLNDGNLTRETPPELRLDSVITNDSGVYTLPDETRLQLVYNFIDPTNAAPKITYTGGKIENREYVSTAWKFPIDTDNNGKFDSYGLYSILFRARPPLVTDRPVVPIEARALPMDETTLSGACVSTGTVATVAGNDGWTASNNQLRKSFFVYAVTVPIKDTESFPANATEALRYETYNGITSISAVELQQDRARSPQNNNAVFFEGDLELVNVAAFRLNGRVYTSGSLMVGALSGNPITFYQVSSSGTATNNPKLLGSCYYEKKNSEIIVAGQVVEGDAVSDNPTTLSTDSTNKSGESSTTAGVVGVHLFLGAGIPPNTLTGTKQITDTKSAASSTVSVDSNTNLSSSIALNDFEYNRRIAALVDQAIARSTVTVSFPISASFNSSNLTYSVATKKDPTLVQDDLIKRIQDEALSSNSEVLIARRASLTAYFGERTRKVSFGEVPFITTGTPAAFSATLLTEIPVTGQPAELAPPIDWMLPSFTNTTFGKTTFSFTPGTDFNAKGVLTGGAGAIALLAAPTTNLLGLSATDPTTVVTSNEKLLGDRVLVGNNLPSKWLKYDRNTNQLAFVSGNVPNYISTDQSVKWNSANESTAGSVERYRSTRSTPLSSLGVTDRGGFWEISAALDPAVSDPFIPTTTVANSTPTTGGLRVVTNAGIYSRNPADTFLPRFHTAVSDDYTSTVAKDLDIDESSVPLWNGQPKDNPITSAINSTTTPPTPIALDERKFAQLKCNTASTAADKGCVDDGRNYVVWPDSMPMSNVNPTTDGRKGDLQMRAAAIYHYKYDAYNAISTPNNYQAPIACVSSYYDPSTPTTAKNASTAPWNNAAGGRSNNGLVYTVGKTASSTDVTFTNIAYDSTTGLFYDSTQSTISSGIYKFNISARSPRLSTANPYGERLAYQANLIFPNGRFANEPLREVLKKIIVDKAVSNASIAGLTLPQQATIDSNLCALQILDGSISLANTTAASANITPAAQVPALTSVQLPHGTFRESAFLDGREVKSLNRNESLTEGANGNSTTNQGLAIATKNRGDIYDLEIEQRQPIEIRATDIDMDRLRGSKISGGNNTIVATDYLLPYSGLVYATREDALADLSYYNKDSSNDPTATPDLDRKNLSSTDFLLDPTRKPSAIRLITISVMLVMHRGGRR